MKVDINQTRNFRINKLFIKKLFATIGRIMPRFSQREVSIAFVDNRTIRQINKTYRKIDAVTDVLSFAEDAGNNRLLTKRYIGEIIIAYPRAKQQASQNKHSVQKELMILLVHGFLHLIGLDHADKKGERKMKALASKILKAI